MKRLLSVLAGAAAPCQTSNPTAPTTTPPALTVAPDTARRMAQWPRTVIDYDRSLVDENASGRRQAHRGLQALGVGEAHDATLNDIPADITPVLPAAGEK